jgi:cellulose synthase operon protein C
MKRLNIKLLAIVAIMFVVLTGGVVVVHGIQMNRNIDTLLKRAEAAKKDDLKTALQLFQRYQSYKPDDVERNAEYAMLLADKAQFATGHSRDYGAAHYMMIHAMTGLEQRPDLKSTMLDLQHRLIDLNIAFHEFGQARDDLDKLKRKGDGDAKSDLKLALCYVNTVEYAKARSLLESLVGYDRETKVFNDKNATAPHELEAYLSLANLLRDKMRDEDAPDRVVMADRVIDQLVKANPDSARAFLIQAGYLAAYQSRDKARPSIEKALELAPEDDEVLLHAAELYLGADEFDKAEPLVQKGISKYPKDSRFYRAGVMLADAQKKPDEAKRRLAAGLEALPRDVPLLVMSFDRQVRDRDFDGARLTLKKLTYAGLRPEYRDYSEAKLLVAEGNMLQASQLLEPLQASTQKIPQLSTMVDSLMVQCYTALNQPDRLLAAANRIPNTAEGLVGKAIALRAMGQEEKSTKIFEGLAKVLEEKNQSANMPQLSGPLFQMRISEQLRKPKDQRDWKEIDSQIAKIREQNAVTEPAISLMEITLLTAKDDKPQAQQRLNELLKKYPGDIAVVVRAVQFALQEPNAARAMQIVDSAPPEIRNHPLLISCRIEAYLTGGGKPDEIKQSLNEITQAAEKLPANDRTQVYINLGMGYLRIGENQVAEQTWNRAAELQPHDTGIRLMLFNLARVTGDLAKMKEIEAWFEKESSHDPAQVKLLQAAVLVGTVRQAQRAQLIANSQVQPSLDDADQRNLVRAKGLLHDVENLRPGWVETPKLLADISMLEGRNDEAINQLHTVMELGQPTGEVIKQLASLLHYRHRDAEAEQVLEANAALVAGDAEVERLRAEVYLMNGKAQAALDTLQNKFPKDSTDPMLHLLHAQMLEGAGKTDEAAAEYRQVTELAPETTEAWLGLVRLLVKADKKDDALRVVQSAQIKLPEDRRALVLAQGYEMLGDLTQAEQGYVSALSSAPQSLLAMQQIAAFYARTNRREQAKKYLNDILATTPQQPVDKECYAWARRMTAELLADGGTYSQFQQAIELLTPPDGRTTAEDLYTRITLLFRRSDPNSSRQALRLLEDLKKVRALSWLEQLNLAQLYERVGDWPSARTEMLSLLAQPKPDPSVYKNYIEMQLRRGAADEASNWMSALQSSGIKVTPEIAFLAARIVSMQGHGPQAAAILLTLLPAQRPLPNDAWSMLGALVGHAEFPGYLEQLGQADQAEKVLHENLGNESQKSVLLAAFLARRGKIDQALDLIEQLRPALGLTNSLHLAMVALSQNFVSPKPEQIQRVEKWFDRALREDPESLAVQMELADLRNVQRRWDDVEKIYRGVLKRTDLLDPQRAVVLNNLSFIIAMQGKDKDEAMRFIAEAVNIYGPQSDMLDTRGIVYLSRGEIDQALADLNDAVIVTDPRPIKFVHLAMAQSRAGDYPGARKSLDKAKDLKFNPDDLSPLEKTQFQSMLKLLGVSM